MRTPMDDGAADCAAGGAHVVSLTRGGCPCGMYRVRWVDGTEGLAVPGRSFAEFFEPFDSIDTAGIVKGRL